MLLTISGLAVEANVRAEKIETLQNSLQTRSEALEEAQKQKADTESSLKKKQQESAEKQLRIETLEGQLQAKANAKAQAVASTTVQAAPAHVTVSGDCASWIREAGVTDVANAMFLINKESGCNPNAVNPSSGACGIPQALPCSKIAGLNPVGQIRWMQNYVNARYGGWAGAVAFWHANHWY